MSTGFAARVREIARIWSGRKRDQGAARARGSRMRNTVSPGRARPSSSRAMRSMARGSRAQGRDLVGQAARSPPRSSSISRGERLRALRAGR